MYVAELNLSGFGHPSRQTDPKKYYH